MKKLIAIAILVVTLVSCGASLSDVKVGMTEAEVTEILGSGNHKSMNSNSFTLDGVEESHSTATWDYDGLGTIEFEDGVVTKVGE
jgi:hypothetical protein